MLRLIVGTALSLSCISVASAEVRILSLQQTLGIASRENPDVVLARLDEERSQEDVRMAQDPFRPKVYGGSGLAWTYGYPNTIEGNAPSLFQMKTNMHLFNRPESYKLAAARELARGTQYAAQSKGEEVAYQAADLFLSASQSEKESEALGSQIPSLEKVSGAMEASVSEGTELPLDSKRAKVNLAVTRQRLDAAKLDADYFEMMLAVALGYPATDRVKPRETEQPSFSIPESESGAADAALRNNRDLRQMQSNVLAKELDLRSYRAQRLPQVDLVAQYALFLKQTYVQYFPNNKFQYNNAQVGAAITIPLFTGSATSAMAQQSVTDLRKMRLQMDQTRNRIIADTRRSYQQWQKAEEIRNLTRMQLDLAREQLTVLLVQNGEGRVPMSQVEQARLEESDRWIGLYEAETQVSRAKFAILRQTGTLMAAVGIAPEKMP
ncbi:MAG: TolC family protein [Bryobacterales bacterium]|nr:TolC family protein [Bryobacterales bacterium]